MHKVTIKSNGEVREYEKDLSSMNISELDDIEIHIKPKQNIQTLVYKKTEEEMSKEKYYKIIMIQNFILYVALYCCYIYIAYKA